MAVTTNNDLLVARRTINAGAGTAAYTQNRGGATHQIGLGSGLGSGWVVVWRAGGASVGGRGSDTALVASVAEQRVGCRRERVAVPG